MKKLVCLLIMGLSLAAGCTKSETKPVSPVVGTWKSGEKDFTATFNNDYTGNAVLNGKKAPFTWSTQPDGSLKVVDESKNNLLFKQEGDKLVFVGSKIYLVRVK